MEIKQCTKCKKDKPVTEFGKHKSGKGGLRAVCRCCHRDIVKAHQSAHPENEKKRHIAWRAKHPENVKIWRHKSRLKTLSTPKGKLDNLMGVKVYRALVCCKESKNWELFFDYTVEQLRTHIEKQFKPGMSWGNYGLWHVDHKIPITLFNYEHPSDLDFKRCWSLNNLQPLWAAENIKKGNKIEGTFQPALAIG